MKSVFRDIVYWWFNVQFRWIARFICKHSLWLNDEDSKRWEQFAKKTKLFFNPYKL